MILSGCCSTCITILPMMKGTPSGQHWLCGVGAPPLNSVSPCFFTISAAPGFKIALLNSPTNKVASPTDAALARKNRPSASKICLRRFLFTTGPGPDAGGSKPGKYGWAHIPEKFGLDATLCASLDPTPTLGDAL